MNTIRIIAAFAVLASAGAASPELSDSYASPVPTRDSTVCIVDSINASEWIRVSQPEALTALLTRRLTAATSESDENGTTRASAVATRSGYRVQVFDDNNPRTAREQAQQRQAQVAAAFPQWRTYITFNSPYWQVKVGDFRRRGEAEAALAEIREAFPSVAAYARVVPEKINITEQ